MTKKSIDKNIKLNSYETDINQKDLAINEKR